MLLKTVSPLFSQRRKRLYQEAPGSIFIFPASEEVVRNGSVTHPFRQESSFYYLTGLQEAGAWLVLSPGEENFCSTLFVQSRDQLKELWEGERYGAERVPGVFGVDQAYAVDELTKRLPGLMGDANKIYYRLNRKPLNDARVLKASEEAVSRGGRKGTGLLPVLDPVAVLGEQRIVKLSEELDFMRKASRASSAAHVKAMEESKPGVNEREIQGLLEYHFMKGGCARVGYGTIVAGGAGATCLHYVANDQALSDGDLVLIDAGGEYEFYTADITRTFPVGRRFTEPQRKVYEIVLKAQKEAIQLARPGNNLKQIHDCAVSHLVEGLLSLGLLKGDPKEIIESEKFKRFYPHNTSHWLGMDVHDTGLYHLGGKSRPFEVGMVFTVEPGLYFQPDDDSVPNEYRGIGIRIEDDIIVTEGDPEVMTAGVPKEISEIEKLRGNA